MAAHRPALVAQWTRNLVNDQATSGRHLAERLIGADVDPAYVDAALARYESFTGTRAKKVSS